MENLRTPLTLNHQRPMEVHSERMTAPSKDIAPAFAPITPAVQSSSIRVQIDRLSLDGFNLPPGGDKLVQVAFETELSRLFSAEELPTLLRSGGARRELPGGALSISSWKDPADLGRQIAHALYEGMAR